VWSATAISGIHASRNPAALRKFFKKFATDRIAITFSIFFMTWQPGDLWVLTGVAESVW
jgi:hypothetical protein